MTPQTFEDKTLICRDCKNEFVWDAGEQEFFAKKGFDNAPTRCRDCRRSHKDQQKPGGKRQMHKIICSDCGQEGEVPFERKDPDSPIYCEKCFRARRGLKQGAQPTAETTPAPETTETES